MVKNCDGGTIVQRSGKQRIQRVDPFRVNSELPFLIAYFCFVLPNWVFTELHARAQTLLFTAHLTCLCSSRNN